jgi:hypothetical protein
LAPTDDDKNISQNNSNQEISMEFYSCDSQSFVDEEYYYSRKTGGDGKRQHSDVEPVPS